jgi:hypothetical protein
MAAPPPLTSKQVTARLIAIDTEIGNLLDERHAAQQFRKKEDESIALQQEKLVLERAAQDQKFNKLRKELMREQFVEGTTGKEVRGVRKPKGSRESDHKSSKRSKLTKVVKRGLEDTSPSTTPKRLHLSSSTQVPAVAFHSSKSTYNTRGAAAAPRDSPKDILCREWSYGGYGSALIREEDADLFRGAIGENSQYWEKNIGRRIQHLRVSVNDS